MQDATGQASSDFQSAKSEISDRLASEKQSATEALHDARDDITRKAGEYVSEAKEALYDHAEGAQQNISAKMTAFGGAMRAASEHLANSDQRAASRLILDAAGGIERLSSSLQNKPFEEVLSEVRSFGRQNAGALFAGSLIAGLAIGRMIKSSAKPDESSDAEGNEVTPSDTFYSDEMVGADSEPLEHTNE